MRCNAPRELIAASRCPEVDARISAERQAQFPFGCEQRAQVHAMVTTLVEDCGGDVIRMTGDMLLACWYVDGARQAGDEAWTGYEGHERAGRAACTCAQEMVAMCVLQDLRHVSTKAAASGVRRDSAATS